MKVNPEKKSSIIIDEINLYTTIGKDIPPLVAQRMKNEALYIIKNSGEFSDIADGHTKLGILAGLVQNTDECLNRYRQAIGIIKNSHLCGKENIFFNYASSLLNIEKYEASYKNFEASGFFYRFADDLNKMIDVSVQTGHIRKAIELIEILDGIDKPEEFHNSWIKYIPFFNAILKYDEKDVVEFFTSTSAFIVNNNSSINDMGYYLRGDNLSVIFKIKSDENVTFEIEKKLFDYLAAIQHKSKILVDVNIELESS
jgi:tetratricopeptide (TPR) repeat protein